MFIVFYLGLHALMVPPVSQATRWGQSGVWGIQMLNIALNVQAYHKLQLETRALLLCKGFDFSSRIINYTFINNNQEIPAISAQL